MCIFDKCTVIFICLLAASFIGIAAGIKCQSGNTMDGFKEMECGGLVNTCMTVICGGPLDGKTFKGCGPSIPAGGDGEVQCSSSHCRIGATIISAKDCKICRGEMCNAGMKCYEGFNDLGFQQKECAPFVNTCTTISCGGALDGKIFKGCGVSAPGDEGELPCSDAYCKLNGIKSDAKDCKFCRGGLCNSPFSDPIVPLAL